MKWPWVSRKRLDSALLSAEAHHALAEHHKVQRDAARARLDDVLAALGVFGQHETGSPVYDPTNERVEAARRHLDDVLIEAVQWRETSQAGGMAGTGYIAKRARSHARLLFRGTKP